MTVFLLLQSLLIPLGAGLAVVQFLLRTEKSLLFKTALAYGLGMGMVSFWMLILGMLKIPYSVSTIGVPLIIVMGVFWFYNLRQKAQGEPPPVRRKFAEPLGFIDWLCLGYIFHQTVFVFVRGLIAPIFSFDAMATVAFTAKVIFYDGSLTYLKNFPHAAYPLHVPFVEAWIAFNLGSWNDPLVKVVFALAFLSLLGVVYYFLHSYTNKRWALFGCVLLVSSNLLTFHATISYRDFFMLYYNCLTVLLLIRWDRTRESGLLVLASLFGGLGSLTKVEGGFYLFVFLLLLAGMVRGPGKAGEKIKTLLFFALPSFGLCATHQIYRMARGVGLEEKAKWQVGWESLTNIPVFLKKLFVAVFLSADWNLVWFLLLLSFFYIVPGWKKREVRFVFLALVGYVGVLFALVMFTNSFFWVAGEGWETGLSRLILHFFPLAPVLIVLLISSRKNPETPLPAEG